MEQLKCINENVCNLDEVLKVLECSSKFGWSWCKEEREPFRHTAIVLYFDKVPRFTVNFRTVDGSSKLSAAFGESDQLVTIEKVLQDVTVKFFDPFEEVYLNNKIGKQRAKDIITSIVYFDPGKYNLFFNNCRDHVKGVVMHLVGKQPTGGEFDEKMKQIRREDTTNKVIAGAAAVAAFAVVVGGAVKLFSSSKEKKNKQ